jgi:hypothetical protein
MKPHLSTGSPHAAIDIGTVGELIAEVQGTDGDIPWCAGEKADPWDHVEAAMGLSIAGYSNAAERAYYWLEKTQLEDGSWYSTYRHGKPDNRTRESNMAAYVAVGVFHHYLISRNSEFLRSMWPTLCKAIDFAVGLQGGGGEIYWALSPEGKTDPMALLTGCSSIFMSLKCALAVADILEHDRPSWKQALRRLEQAIQTRPQLFNMTKSRYSMDWFYPILSGAITGMQAQERINQSWKKFVVEEQGVRCVSDRPWVTIAETCEFCLTLSAMGNHTLAEIIFSWICDKKYEDGAYWCGFTCPDMTIWPEDKLTWTHGVLLLAADALYHLTPGDRLFNHQFWNDLRQRCDF